jgi:hypothetical protein
VLGFFINRIGDDEQERRSNLIKIVSHINHHMHLTMNCYMDMTEEEILDLFMSIKRAYKTKSRRH